jgi:hypothetical protein
MTAAPGPVRPDIEPAVGSDRRVALVRIGCGLLAVSSLIVGVRAAFFPRSFYDQFPGGGHAWVAADGPYNEHLVRDVGQLNLGFAILLAAVALAVGLAAHRGTAAAVLTAYLVPATLHFTYHAAHLNLYGTGDAAGNVISLGLAVVVPAALLFLLARPPRLSPPERSGYP